MRHIPFLTAVLLGITSVAAHAQAPATQALHVQRVEFIDRQGFEKPLRAATMMVPTSSATM